MYFRMVKNISTAQLVKFFTEKKDRKFIDLQISNFDFSDFNSIKLIV